MLNGYKDSAAIRMSFEISKWAIVAFRKSYALLRNSMGLAEQVFNLT
jgi:hypothetical protein